MAVGRPSEKDDRREQQTREWLQKQNGYAVASMVLGVFSFIEFGALPIIGIGAVVTGVIGLRQLRRPTGERKSGRGLAIAGMTLGVISLAVGITLLSLRPGG
jgi:hypothetical protein